MCKQIDTKKELNDLLISKKCYCYGAGVYGKRFVEYCKKENFSIAGFVVSDDQTCNDKCVLGLSVQPVKEIFKENDYAIIIAIAEKNQVNIIEKLHGNISSDDIYYLSNVPYFLFEEFEREVERRRHLSIFEYQELSKPLMHITPEKCALNAMYGDDRIIKKILHKDRLEILDASIEHGPGPSGNILERQEIFYGRTYYTANKNRASFFSKIVKEKKFISVGLYMQYVNKLLNETELHKIKTMLGRTLLVFPYHSIMDITAKFNTDDFIEKIETIKDKYHFDTVLICLFCIDVLAGMDKIYVDHGFKIVTAGYINDYYFLYRLSTIIQLSDMTMSNDIGSQIGYCVYLGKPHYLYMQKINHIKNGEVLKDSDKVGLVSKNDCIIPFDYEFQYKVLKKTLEHFGEYKEYLTDADVDFVKYYWGEW